MEPREQLGHNIRRLRLAQKRSQLDLGLSSDIDMSEISKLELGKKDPQLNTMVKVAAGLGVSLSELVEGIGPRR